MYSIFYCTDRKNRDERNYYIEYYAGTTEDFAEALAWVEWLQWTTDAPDSGAMYYAYYRYEELAPSAEEAVVSEYEHLVPRALHAA